MAWPPPEPVVTASLACLVDCSTGQIVWSKSPTTQHANASTTKWMAVMLACEIIGAASSGGTFPAGGLQQVVTVDSSHIVGGSSGGLHAGDQLTAEDCLHAGIKVSANEAVTALAGHIGKYYLGAASTAYSSGVQAYVARMNQRLVELGLTNSHFVTPSGIPAAGHYMCAADLAHLAAFAVGVPDFAAIWSRNTWHTTITRSGAPFDMHWSADIAGWAYPGALACKAGDWPGLCKALAIVAQRGSTRLAAAFIMDDLPENYINDVRAMLDYGFRLRREYTEAVFKFGESSSYLGYTLNGTGNVDAWGESGYFPALYNEGYTRISVSPNQAMAFNMLGTRIEWFTYQSPSRGRCNVYLDGLFDKLVDLYATSFFGLIAYSHDFVTRGAHLVELRPTTRNPSSTGNTVEVDYVNVYDAIPPDYLVAGTIIEAGDTMTCNIGVGQFVDPFYVLSGHWQEPGNDTAAGAMTFVAPEVPVDIPPDPSQISPYLRIRADVDRLIYGVGGGIIIVPPDPNAPRLTFAHCSARGGIAFSLVRERAPHALTRWG